MKFTKNFIPTLTGLDSILAWLGLTAGLLMVIPKQFIDYPLVQANQGVFAILLIISIAYFFSLLIKQLWQLGLSAWHLRDQQQKLQAFVACLDHTERAILREFVIRRSGVIALPLSEPSVANLIRNCVLEPAHDEQHIESRSMVECKISLEARPLLSYRALSLPVGKLSEEQLDKFKRMRPIFLQPEFQTNRTHSGKLIRIKAHHEDVDDQNAA